MSRLVLVSVLVPVGHDLLETLGRTVRLALGSTVDRAIAHAVHGLLRLVHSILDGLVVHGISSVGGIDKGVETGALTRVLLHQLLVSSQSLVHLLGRDVVQEHAGTDRVGHGSTEQTVTSLQDSLGGLVEHVLVEQLVVHGQTSPGEQVQQPPVLLVAEETALVCQCRRVGHVDGDGMSVTERNLG